VGDEIYNEGRDNTVADTNIRTAIRSLGRFFLHAERLAFSHPKTGEQMSYEQKMPEELTQFLRLL
jgi:23S rRNA-/tRNA-specific pseudouridylate synthase